MFALTLLLLRAITTACRGHHEVVLENLALRHQLRTLQRRVKRPHLRTRDRMFWVLLATAWRQWPERPSPAVAAAAASKVGSPFRTRW